MDDYKLGYDEGYEAGDTQGYREGYNEGYLKALLLIRYELDFLEEGEEAILYLKEFLDYEIEKLEDKGVTL